MTHDTDNAPADIAWMRQLAEEGARGPMRGASILMAAGLVYGLTGLIHWSVVAGLVAMPTGVFTALWGVATVLFLAILIVLLWRRRQCGVVTAANRAYGAAWRAVGWGIFALLSAMTLVASRSGGVSAIILLALLPSVIMVFYGMGWAVTAAMMKSRPLWGLAIASFVAAPLLGLLAGQDVQYLAYGAALLLLMALPGWLLMRQAGRA